MLDDNRVAHCFDGVGMHRRQAHQTQFLSSVTGGPVEYTGRDMQSVHADLDSEEFDVIETHLDQALAECGIDDTNRNAVLEAFYQYEDAIVTTPKVD